MNRPMQITHDGTLAGGRTERLTRGLSAFVVIALGVALLFGAGFAQPETLHNAAHDARHAFSTPCH